MKKLFRTVDFIMELKLHEVILKNDIRRKTHFILNNELAQLKLQITVRAI